MRDLGALLGFRVMILVSSVAAAASAAPIVTYPELDPSASNALTVVQVTGSATCPIGSGNCLANAPVAIDAASVTLDLGTNELLDLWMLSSGPGDIVLSGYNGYERIVFHDAAFQSSGSAVLGSGGSFAIGGTVTASSLEIFRAGNQSALPDIVYLDYTTVPNPNFASGTIGVSASQVAVAVNGIDFGSFPDPRTGNLFNVKADLGFVAVVPEPDAALLYGVGLLITGSVLRRRSAPTAGERGRLSWGSRGEDR